jgi:hypothetical protein
MGLTLDFVCNFVVETWIYTMLNGKKGGKFFHNSLMHRTFQVMVVSMHSPWVLVVCEVHVHQSLSWFMFVIFEVCEPFKILVTSWYQRETYWR